jgi:hypothetical protein
MVQGDHVLRAQARSQTTAPVRRPLRPGVVLRLRTVRGHGREENFSSRCGWPATMIVSLAEMRVSGSA